MSIQALWEAACPELDEPDAMATMSALQRHGREMPGADSVLPPRQSAGNPKPAGHDFETDVLAGVLPVQLETRLEATTQRLALLQQLSVQADAMQRMLGRLEDTQEDIRSASAGVHALRLLFEIPTAANVGGPPDDAIDRGGILSHATRSHCQLDRVRAILGHYEGLDSLWAFFHSPLRGKDPSAGGSAAEKDATGGDATGEDATGENVEGAAVRLRQAHDYFAQTSTARDAHLYRLKYGQLLERAVGVLEAACCEQDGVVGRVRWTAAFSALVHGLSQYSRPSSANCPCPGARGR